MSKTIKIIDLLNKIANGEEVPKKIKYQCVIGKWNNGMLDYMYNDVAGIFDDFIFNLCNDLNNEVEIIEEQEEIDIQNLKETDIEKDRSGMEYYTYSNKNNTETRYSVNYSASDIETRKKINELVQAVKQLDLKVKEK